jgi:hypothetical protein
MAEPPLLDGAVQLNVIWLEGLTVADSPVGAPETTDVTVKEVLVVPVSPLALALIV